MSLRADFNELVRGPDGKIAASKFWFTVAAVVSTWVVIHETLEPGPVPEFLLLAYLGVLAGYDYGKKRLNVPTT